jgi:hypothetical protein
MPDRGVIKNRRRGSQIRDFSKLRIGNITPTDLDMLIEYYNQCFVFCETKHSGADLPDGQSLALERLCDACEHAGKPSILFITVHDSDAGEDIDMGMTIVISYRYKLRWQTPKEPIYLKDAVLGFIEKQTAAYYEAH